MDQFILKIHIERDWTDPLDVAFGNFIVTTSLGKEDPETRKLIRSHVMRGKNKGKKMPRKIKSSHACTTVSDPEATSGSTRQNGPRNYSQEDREWALYPPRKIATELALFGPTTHLDPSMQRLIHQAYTVLKPAMYAVQVFGDRGSGSDVFCFKNLSLHPAMIPVLLFTVQAFQDSVLGRPARNRAHFYLAKALNLLQKSLYDQTTATSYATMVVVASLASGALVLGDLETANKHMDGLMKMLEVRGGLESLGDDNMVAHKARSYVLFKLSFFFFFFFFSFPFYFG